MQDNPFAEIALDGSSSRITFAPVLVALTISMI